MNKMQVQDKFNTYSSDFASYWEVNYTIGTTQLGNLKSDELDQHLKQMKVGDEKELTLTARLTDSATYWSWRNENQAKKDEQFSMNVKVFEKI